MEHSKLPWIGKVSTDCMGELTTDIMSACRHDVAADVDIDANVNLILTAVNNHEKLIGALSTLMGVSRGSVEISDWPELQKAIEDAERALENAGAFDIG